LQFEDDDSQDFLDRPLSKDQGRRLLRLIADTMKRQWRALPVEDREPYTVFVQGVLTQLRIYRYEDLEVDRWFTDPQEPEFPKEMSFADNLLLPPDQKPRNLDESVIHIFTTANLQAAGTDQEASWVRDLVEALSATQNMVDADGHLGIDTNLQFDFMADVLAPCLERSFTGPSTALFVRPLVTALISLVQDWHFRVDATRNETLQRMLSTSSALLASLQKALNVDDVVSFIGKGYAGVLIYQFLELAICCVRRLDMLEQLVDDTEENVDALEKGCTSALWIHDRLCGGQVDNNASMFGPLEPQAGIKSMVLRVLDQGMNGNNDGRMHGLAWRADDPMAQSWDAWTRSIDDETHSSRERHDKIMQKLEQVLIDADMLEEGQRRFSSSSLGLSTM
jgi:hypothetical protein